MSVIATAVAIGRQVAAQYRDDVVHVLRGTSSTPDGEGGWDETPAVAFTTSGVLTAGATRPEERVIADRAGSQTPYVVRNLPYDADIRATDELVISGRTFAILGVLRNEAANVAQTAVCEERS